MSMNNRDVAIAISNEQMAVIQGVHGNDETAAYHWQVSADAYRRLGDEAKAAKAEACAAKARARSARNAA